MDFENLSKQLLRSLRGRRSQQLFSRHLGYRSNVAYTWESGRRFPSASQFLNVVDVVGKQSLVASLHEFFGYVAPNWVVDAGPNPDTVSRLLAELRGGASVSEIARRSGLSRFAVGRALSGESDPRLPDFLRLIAAMSKRLMDLLAVFVDPASLPEAAQQWKQVSTLRTLAYDFPASEAVLCALELAGYRRLTRHDDAWVAEKVSLEIEMVRSCLRALSRAGSIRWSGRRWLVADERHIDTRFDAEAALRLKKHWVNLASSSVGQQDGLFSYIVFTVSPQTLAELRELHLAYYWRLREVIDAADDDATEVCVANINLFGLATEEQGRS
jgi:DNA-binding phage protein